MIGSIQDDRGVTRGRGGLGGAWGGTGEVDKAGPSVIRPNARNGRAPGSARGRDDLRSTAHWTVCWSTDPVDRSVPHRFRRRTALSTCDVAQGDGLHSVLERFCADGIRIDVYSGAIGHGRHLASPGPVSGSKRLVGRSAVARTAISPASSMADREAGGRGAMRPGRGGMTGRTPLVCLGSGEVCAETRE